MGNLAPRPREEWLLLARKAERAPSDGQQPLPIEEPDPLVEQIVAKARTAKENMVSIEKTLRDRGCHLSWQTVRETLRTHQVVTAVLPLAEGGTLRIRTGSTPEPQHLEIYRLLSIDPEIMKPIKSWSAAVS